MDKVFLPLLLSVARGSHVDLYFPAWVLYNQSLCVGRKTHPAVWGRRQLTSLARESHCVHSNTAGPQNLDAGQAGNILAAWKEHD